MRRANEAYVMPMRRANEVYVMPMRHRMWHEDPRSRLRKKGASEIMDVPASGKTKPGTELMIGIYGTHELTVSKCVGNCSLVMKELTDGWDLEPFDRWRQTLFLSGIPGACVCTATISGEEMKGPRRICSISD